VHRVGAGKLQGKRDGSPFACGVGMRPTLRACVVALALIAAPIAIFGIGLAAAATGHAPLATAAQPAP
jgi:hypothetical protein